VTLRVYTVRHMTQMEHVYLSWGLGGGDQSPIFRDDDYAGGSVETVASDVQRYIAEVEEADHLRAEDGWRRWRMANFLRVHV
jgi:hypothetical protein